jgi:tRNA modification GTPase
MTLLVEIFKELGFEEAPPGEFTKRAFLNNKISLNEAESVVDIIDSSNVDDVFLSSKSLSGDFTKAIFGFAKEIDFLRVRVEGEIDFSDEGQDFLDSSLLDDLKTLISRFNLFVGGCVNKKSRSTKRKVLFIGPVNSGKSSVFNRLLGFERALVSNVPGTTRDLIESEVFYNNLSFHVSDSAGFRETDDLIESKGIDYGVSQIGESDVVVGIFDSESIVLQKKFQDLVGDKSYISLLNKVDLKVADEVVLDGVDCMVSAKTGEGFDEFKFLLEKTFENSALTDSTYLVRDRHIKLFDESVVNLRQSFEKLEASGLLELAAEDLKMARSCLDSVVGLKTADALLGDIFSSFCIGK